jgi:ligand-binding sensor domain-containing protein
MGWAPRLSFAAPGRAGWTSYTGGNHVMDVAFDPAGRLWAVGSGEAVRWDLSTGAYIKYTTQDGLTDNWVLTVAVARDGAVWFGTAGRGVSRFDGVMWKKYTAKNGLAGNIVYAIAVGLNGSVWFGTEHGVSRYDGKSWKTYTVRDGLADDMVVAIAVDPGGSLWFGTYRGGVSRFLPRR